MIGCWIRSLVNCLFVLCAPFESSLRSEIIVDRFPSSTDESEIILEIFGWLGENYCVARISWNFLDSLLHFRRKKREKGKRASKSSVAFSEEESDGRWSTERGWWLVDRNLSLLRGFLSHKTESLGLLSTSSGSVTREGSVTDAGLPDTLP